MTMSSPESEQLLLVQRWGSALAVVATAAVTLVCLTDQLTEPSFPWVAGCLLLSIAPPLAFGALSLRPDQSIEAAWAQLLTTLCVAGLLGYAYLDVAFQAFGPHRHSSTESTVFILAPLAAFPLGAWVFAVVWGAGKLVGFGAGRTERKPPLLLRAAERASAGAGRGEGAPRGQRLGAALVLAIALGVAYLFVSAHRQEQAAKDPSTPPDVLVRLARNSRLQYYVAGNPHTPPATLARLAALPDPVRMMSFALARNPSTPPDLLCELAELPPRPGTSDWEIKAGVEENRSTPPAVVRALRRLHPSGPPDQDWQAWPKESQPDCAQFKKPGP